MSTAPITATLAKPANQSELVSRAAQELAIPVEVMTLATKPALILARAIPARLPAAILATHATKPATRGAARIPAIPGV
jgi:hypothetical protein